MAYDSYLAERISNALHEHGAQFSEKKMMGGLAFMVNDKMCVGIIREMLMARVGPDVYEDCLKLPGAKAMDFTGRPMKGFVFVEPSGLDSQASLERWVKLALDFNPKAKSSKK